MTPEEAGHEMKASSPVLVVGAGIVGLSTALFLSRRGRSVVVLDREPIGSGASSGNAGLLANGHPPLPRPGVSVQCLRWMLDRSSPVHIKPRLDPPLLAWLWQFHRHCAAGWTERCMPVLAAMGRQSMALYEEILESEGIECDYGRDGWLEVFAEPGNLDAGEAEGRWLSRWGYSHERISGEALREREPIFRDHVAGAILYHDSAHLSPGDFMRKLGRKLIERGVKIRDDAIVKRVLHDSGAVAGVELESRERLAGSAVVLAAGIWSDRLARTAGLAIPMQGARGYHVQLDGLSRLPSTSCVLHETLVAATPMYDQLRLAGTLEIGPLESPWQRERLDALLGGARRYLRGLESARVVEEWAGFRPCTADGMPVIGPTRLPGLYVGTGHAMMGMMLGPATGMMLADAIAGERPQIDSPLVAAKRFE